MFIRINLLTFQFGSSAHSGYLSLDSAGSSGKEMLIMEQRTDD